jgi:hypothetical protein
MAMYFVDLIVGDSTQALLAQMNYGDIHGFPGTHNGKVSTYGFLCQSMNGARLKATNATPSVVYKGDDIAEGPTDLQVMYGIMMFDHAPNGESVPDWRNYPAQPLALRTGYNCQAALVYGNVRTTPNPLALRLYWANRLTATEFTHELQRILMSN